MNQGDELTPKEIDPHDAGRAVAYSLWSSAPNPTITFFKTLDVTNLAKVCRKRRLKFNMATVYCIGKAASGVREFYTLPVGDKLIQYDSIAVSVVVKNRAGDINSCDIRFSENLDDFNRDYISSVAWVADNCADRDLWGKYRRRMFHFYLPISFQFHHVQMDGAHAGRFLACLQDEIRRLK